jgi:hypothetical protein
MINSSIVPLSFIHNFFLIVSRPRSTPSPLLPQTVSSHFTKANLTAKYHQVLQDGEPRYWQSQQSEDAQQLCEQRHCTTSRTYASHNPKVSPNIISESRHFCCNFNSLLKKLDSASFSLRSGSMNGFSRAVDDEWTHSDAGVYLAQFHLSHLNHMKIHYSLRGNSLNRHNWKIQGHITVMSFVSRVLNSCSTIFRTVEDPDHSSSLTGWRLSGSQKSQESCLHVISWTWISFRRLSCFQWQFLCLHFLSITFRFWLWFVLKKRMCRLGSFDSSSISV